MNKNLKIAIFEPRIGNVGGSQKAIAKIAHYLKSKGHKVEFFTQKYDRNTPYKEFKEVKINEIGPRQKIFLPFIFLFKKVRGFDLIILSAFPANLGSIRNNPTITICYSPTRTFFDLRQYLLKNSNFKEKIKIISKNLLLKKLEIIASKKTSKILTNSKTVQRRVKKYYKINSEPFYHGVGFENFKCKRYGNYILSVSRFVNAKRTDIAIKSMGLIKNKNIKMYVVGDGDDKSEIKNLCKNYQNVKFIGKVSDEKLKELYSNCLAVVCIPINEDWGLIPLEAGASRKTVIGANEGGLKETIIDKKTGFLLKEITPQRIAEKIDFLADNKKIAIKMGGNARKYTEQFDWENNFHILDKAILEVLSVRGK